MGKSNLIGRSTIPTMRGKPIRLGLVSTPFSETQKSHCIEYQNMLKNILTHY